MPDKITQELKLSEKLAKEFRQMREFQFIDQRYVDLLHSEFELVRLEVLGAILEDVISVPKHELLGLIEHGSTLERMYAILAICRNFPEEWSKLINNICFDEIDLGNIWKLSCQYALNPSVTNMVNLAVFITHKNTDAFQLALNLLVIITNALHRVLLVDMIKIYLKSDVLHQIRNRELAKVRRLLNAKQSWIAIGKYKFNRDELSQFLS